MRKLKRLWWSNHQKGFTLIELIVVMAVIAVLVLLAAPRFLGKTKEADKTRHVANAKTIEDAAERYFIDEQDWPRLTDDAYTSEEIESYSERVLDVTGEEITLDPEGNYYDIDYEALSKYVKLPSDSDKNNYILRNPVGKIYYLEGLTEEGRSRTNYEDSQEKDSKNEPEEPIAFKGSNSSLFDGDNTSYIRTSSATISWDGDLSHREVSILTQNSDQHSDSKVEFLDVQGNKLNIPGTNQTSQVINKSGNSRPTLIHRVIVPEGATEMRIFNNGWLDTVMVYEVSVIR